MYFLVQAAGPGGFYLIDLPDPTTPAAVERWKDAVVKVADAEYTNQSMDSFIVRLIHPDDLSELNLEVRKAYVERSNYHRERIKQENEHKRSIQQAKLEGELKAARAKLESAGYEVKEKPCRSKKT